MKFKAGKYIIVDLCYVVPNEYWDELCNQWFPKPRNNYTEEKIVSYFDEILEQEVECYALGTAHGDGVYYDNLGNEYGVDAGIIGIIAFDDVRDENISDNNVFDFENDFEVYNDDGVLNFGHIHINTDYTDDEDN